MLSLGKRVNFKILISPSGLFLLHMNMVSGFFWQVFFGNLDPMGHFQFSDFKPVCRMEFFDICSIKAPFTQKLSDYVGLKEPSPKVLPDPGFGFNGLG